VTANRPGPLPVRVRPVAGKASSPTYDAWPEPTIYAPSLLQIYVRNPAASSAAIVLERLAAVSGSTLACLTHALVGLPRPRRRPASSTSQPTSLPKPQAARKAHLFKTIRADHARGLSIRRIAQRHHVHRRMVRQALNSPTPQPPPRKKINRSAPVLDPIRDTIDGLLNQNLTAWQIWTHLVDEHDADASYTTVRDYIQTRNHTSPSKIH
jgi:hypothetical protein